MPYGSRIEGLPRYLSFQKVTKEERRKQYLHLKEASVRASVLLEGEQL